MLLNGQDVANRRQNRAGHAEQGSVIQNKTATAAATVCLTGVYIFY